MPAPLVATGFPIDKLLMEYRAACHCCGDGSSRQHWIALPPPGRQSIAQWVNWLWELALLNEPVKRASTKAGHGEDGGNAKQSLAVNGRHVLDFHKVSGPIVAVG